MQHSLSHRELFLKLISLPSKPIVFISRTSTFGKTAWQKTVMSLPNKHSILSTHYESSLSTTFARSHQELRSHNQRFGKAQKLLSSSALETHRSVNTTQRNCLTVQVQTLFSCSAPQNTHTIYGFLLPFRPGLIRVHISSLPPLLPALSPLSAWCTRPY